MTKKFQKMRKSQIDYIIGDKPNFSDSTVYDVFNWYSSKFYTENINAFLLCGKFFEKYSSSDKSILIGKKSVINTYFSSTDWAVIDQYLSDCIVPEEFLKNCHKRIKSYCFKQQDSFSLSVDPRENTTKRSLISNIEDYVDEQFISILHNKITNFKYDDLAKEQNINERQQKEIVTFYTPIFEDVKKSIENNLEGYERLSEKQKQQLIDLFNDIVSYKKKRVAYKKRKNYVEKPKHCFPEYEKLVNKKRIILYDEEKGKAIVLFSQSGLDLKGKKFINIDEDKSYIKNMSSPKKLVNELLNSKAFNKAFKVVELSVSKKLPAKFVLREGFKIISYD